MIRNETQKRITTQTLLDLLLARHSKDLAIPECKSGPTHYASTFQKIDLWVMKKSWASPQTYGYEIKVSRNDFLRDDKWQNYLEFCSDLYFVAPPGVIEKEEVPADAGLLVSSNNGTRLYTKKKAPHRNVEIPDSIYRYVLMWRTQVVRESLLKQDKKEYWKNWLKEKDEKKQLGYMVSGKIRRLVDERIEKVESENRWILAENKKFDKAREILSKLGILDVRQVEYNTERLLKEAIALASTGIPEGLVRYLGDAVSKIEGAHKILTSVMLQKVD